MSGPHDLAARALRTLDPEAAHRLTIRALALGLGPISLRRDPILATKLAGLHIQNPVGLAAGFDKNAEVYRPMLRAGFGFVECGTVTPRPQPGNPKPRLFRLSEDEAVINRLGFNNQGHEAVLRRLPLAGRGVVGVNIGANKDSEDRIGDYVAGVRRFVASAAYLTINISSPNTPGLRDLQSAAALSELLERVGEELLTAYQDLRIDRYVALPPLFLKVAPDLSEHEVRDIADAVAASRVNGVIVSNTTTSRPDGLKSPFRTETGGLSGRPLFAPSTRMLRLFREALPARVVLIGAGGVGSGEQAYAKIRAGASAVQLYSALVYGGPGLVTRIKRDLAARLRADGFASVAQAVGAA